MELDDDICYRAVLARDADLAHFEANRTNRREVLRILEESGAR